MIMSQICESEVEALEGLKCGIFLLIFDPVAYSANLLEV